MAGNEMMNVCRITILSDIGAIVILALIGIHVLFFRKNRRSSQDGIFLRGLFLTVVASAANGIQMLFMLYPEHASDLSAMVAFALELIALELGYVSLVRYLLSAGQKKAAAGIRMHLLRVPAWIVCILSAVSVRTQLMFFPFEKHIVIYSVLGVLIAAAPVVIETLICVICLWKGNKSLLSVFLFLFVMRLYLGFVLEESFAISAVLALGIVYAYFIVHSRGSLLRIGSVIILMFIGATLLIGNYTMRAVSSFYIRTIREENEKSLGTIRKNLSNQGMIVWLMNYWVDHGEEIAQAIGKQDLVGDIDNLLAYDEIIQKTGKSAASVTGEDLEALSEEDQKTFAMIAYALDESSFLFDAKYYSLDELKLVSEDSSGNLTVIFDAAKKKGGKCPLHAPVDRTLLEYSWLNYEELASPDYFNPFFNHYSEADQFGYHEEFALEGLKQPAMFCVSISSFEISEKLSFISGLRRKTILILTIVAILILLLLYITALRPLRRVTESVSDYQEDKDAVRTRERLKTIRSGNEIGILAREFTSLAEEMDRYTDEVAKMAGDREKVNTELRTAAQIQESVLPDTFPAFPERTEFDLYARMDPMKEVGGDFYDFFLTDENHLAILIADVSDKGIPAALFMMSAKNLINYRAKKGGTPGQILTEINEQICSDSLSQMFVTVWMGIIDLRSGWMTCTNAGHEYPILRGADGTFQIYKDRHGFVIGGMAGITYKDYQVHLNPGDAIFVYTDGVPEANNADGEFYGMERLTMALNRAAKKTPAEILYAVRADVDAFVNGADQFDDLTMLCLEYRGTGTAEHAPAHENEQVRGKT